MISATIVTGAVLGRIRPIGHIVGTIVISGFLFPIVSRFSINKAQEPVTSALCEHNDIFEVNYEGCSVSSFMDSNGFLDFAGGIRFET